MESRLLSDALLRSRISPLLSFLAPSISPLSRSAMASPQTRLLMPKSPRYRTSNIHTTSSQRADSSTNDADLDFLKDKPESKPRQLFRAPFPPKRRPDDVVGNQLDTLLGSTFRSPTLAKRRPSERGDESSDVMMETAYENSVRSRDPSVYQYNIAQNMLFPPQGTVGAGEPTNISHDAYRTLENTQRLPKRAKRTVRSRPAVGRTIEVNPDRGMDVGRALKSLDIACAVNKVRQDQSRQRFHERPGMKRKRLESERWRKMFKESFRATVMRVKEMRRKGW